MRVVQWLDAMGERGREILADPERFFGAQVRAHRKRLGWSQRELAEHLSHLTSVKLDTSAITRIEAGRTVSLKQAVALAYTLGAEAMDMMLDDQVDEVDLVTWLERARQNLEERETEQRDLRFRLDLNEQLIRTQREQIAEAAEKLKRAAVIEVESATHDDRDGRDA